MTSIVKHQAAIALLVAILSNFSNCDYCPVSVPTVSVVSNCPTTKTEWDEAASRKKCSHMSAKCGEKSPVYHCLLNQWRNETVEVCASDWYISGFCAIYNTEEMKVIDDFSRDCTNLTGGPCPTRYISTNAYMYQGCYGKRNTSTSLPSTDKQVHVSTDCTSPAALIAIIIVLSLLSLILVLLLVLTCQEKISKSVMYRHCMRLCKQTPDEERAMEGSQDACSRDEESNMFIAMEGSQDACSRDEESNRETDSLLPGEPKSVSPRTDKTEEKNNTMPVKEKIKQFEPKSVTPRTDKTEEKNNTMPVKEKIKQFEPKKVSPRTDKTEEKNNTMPVKEKIKQFDPSDNMEDFNTKNEDLNAESLEEGKVILDGGTDSPDDDDRKLVCIDKDELEEDRLHENDSKVMEMQCMLSKEISSGKNERGSESESESQKEPEIGEENNGEEVFDSNTDIESSSSSSNESKNSTETEEQLNAKETQNLVKARVENFQKIISKQN